MEGDRTPTRFCVGGVYKRALGGKNEIQGVLLGSSVHNSGRRTGVIHTEGHASETVIEHTDSLNEWTLIAEPIATELLRRMEEGLLHRLEALEQKLAPAPPHQADPLQDLVVLDGRKSKAAARS